MDIEGIMISEIIRHRKTNKILFHLHVESKKAEEINKHSKTETES